ncbi:MAG: hypothetical protein K0Q72_4067, partial [Armatimonadetes bacterium]|nr:hypothetical protein [Armatimonadota bacterium]
MAGLLISKLESASPRVAKVAETELLWLGAACIPVLRQVIRTGPWNARSRAVRVLGLLPDPEVISALTEAFRAVSAAPTSTYLYADRDEDEEEWEPDAATALRLQIVKTLGSRRDPRILPFLLEVLQHPRWKERRAAAIELARWAGMDPVPALRTALPPLRLLIAGSGGGSTEPERYACRVALH